MKNNFEATCNRGCLSSCRSPHGPNTVVLAMRYLMPLSLPFLSPPLRQEIRNPYLVKMHSAHPHRIATYDERGVQTTGGKVVLIQAEFCAGGSLQNHLNLLLGSSGKTSTAERSFDREVERRKVYTPEAESMLKAEEEKKRRKARNAPSSTDNKIAGRSAPRREPLGAGGAAQGDTLSQRLEVWVRQVKRHSPRMRSDLGVEAT